MRGKLSVMIFQTVFVKAAIVNCYVMVYFQKVNHDSKITVTLFFTKKLTPCEECSTLADSGQNAKSGSTVLRVSLQLYSAWPCQPTI